MANTSDEYRTTFGTSAVNGKVHAAHGRGDRQTLLCRFNGAKLSKVLGQHEGGREDLFDALMQAGIKISQLCASCFKPIERANYKAAIGEAKAAEDEADYVIKVLGDERSTWTDRIGLRRRVRRAAAAGLPMTIQRIADRSKSDEGVPVRVLREGHTWSVVGRAGQVIVTVHGQELADGDPAVVSGLPDDGVKCELVALDRRTKL
jgi:hypothetical protein